MARAAPSSFVYLKGLRAYLNAAYPDEWIGRAGPTPWPARSPDMSPLDFYLWGRLKSLVYASAAPNVEVLQQRIEHACGIVRDELNGLCDVQRSLSGEHSRLKRRRLSDKVNLIHGNGFFVLIFHLTLLRIDDTYDVILTLQRDLAKVNVDKNSIKHTTMRVLLLQTIAPGTPLLPQPVLTLWGMLLDAVNYYAEYYGKIMDLIGALDSTDSSAVAAVKSLPSEQLLEDILFNDSNFKSRVQKHHPVRIV
ncbi:hypothetical protein ANN_24024 [Periplaneta americana]|uniref:Uncharacterized protein n=1 Tax=Periplaneta americana TaxID=6978 RepID=A0ABQ8S2M0_PERAM|nr:hypothetical protein ANN_24024 [Periplaneta americana]